MKHMYLPKCIEIICSLTGIDGPMANFHLLAHGLTRRY